MSIHTEQPTKKPSDSPIPDGRQLPGRPRRKKAAGWAKMLILVELALLVALLGGDIPSLVSKSVRPVVETVPVTGPFAQVPLNTDEIAKLYHLSTHLNTKTLVNMYLSHMTLDQKLGQLFMVQYWGYSYSADLETMLHDQYAGGVIMYAAQMNTLNQTRSDIVRMQESAWMPLLISTDEEGGYVQRIMNIFGNHPGALQTYETGNIQNAALLGHSIAHELQTLGINTDLAPDVDVPVVMGPDQYMRTWGYTPQSVIAWGGTYLRAVQGDGEIACLKHFPGLGAATTDAHQDLPVVKRTLDQLYATELAPFRVRNAATSDAMPAEPQLAEAD